MTNQGFASKAQLSRSTALPAVRDSYLDGCVLSMRGVEMTDDLAALHRCLDRFHAEAKAAEAEAQTWVRAEWGCPGCGERIMDELIWVDDATVECQTCGHSYVPGFGARETA